jgi:hypothetical protein
VSHRLERAATFEAERAAFVEQNVAAASNQAATTSFKDKLIARRLAATTTTTTTTAPRGRSAQSVAAYTSSKDGCLSMQKGEIFTVLDSSSQWWGVRNQKGKEGKVPSNFLKFIEASELIEASGAGVSVLAMGTWLSLPPPPHRCPADAA